MSRRLGIKYYEEASKYFRYNPTSGNLHYMKANRENRVGDIAGSYSNGYIVIGCMGKLLRAHRLSFYIMEGYLTEDIDHINGIGYDNRWLNLRGCTHSENMRNKRIGISNTSGYRGVTLRSGYTDKWRGQVTLNGVNYNKTGFKTPELANDWVVNKSREVYGEFYN